MKKIIAFFKAIKSYLNGDFAYENYLKHQKQIHATQKILSKKEFFLTRQKQKWGNVNRCC